MTAIVEKTESVSADDSPRSDGIDSIADSVSFQQLGSNRLPFRPQFRSQKSSDCHSDQYTGDAGEKYVTNGDASIPLVLMMVGRSPIDFAVPLLTEIQ